MNGPDHYRQAEQALAAATRSSLADGEAGYHLAAAQAHATLAVAAALVEVAEWQRVACSGDVVESTAWLQVVKP